MTLEDTEKIEFIDKLLSQASKRLDFFGNPSEFYLFDDALFFKLGTDSSFVNLVDEKTNKTFSYILCDELLSIAQEGHVWLSTGVELVHDKETLDELLVEMDLVDAGDQ